MADATVRLSSTQSPHLIELYHGHDALWTIIICSPQYKDRNVHEVCYCLLRTVTVTVIVGCFLGWEGDSINKLKAMRRGSNVGNISDT